MSLSTHTSLRVAYFTMEIAPKVGIPTFAGGLGVLAGDIMRSCADLGVNAACMTMAWQFGYLKQSLNSDGSQNYADVTWNFEEHLTKLPHRVTVMLEGREVHVGVWELMLPSQSQAPGSHSVPIYFLDTNLPENSAEDREITKHLYGGDQSMRIKQEVVLGIGGVRMLRAFGYQDVGTYHMNEGHCAFLTLELLKERGFNDDAVRQNCAFTTHTPVKAGHDVFDYDHAWKIVGDMLPWHIKKIAGEDALSMTTLAMTLSRYTCGVSKVHGQVAREMLGNPNVDYITNGVHHIEWTSDVMAALFDLYIPGWRHDPSLLTDGSKHIPAEALWNAHMTSKQTLLQEVKDRTGTELDPNVLTIASARRVVPYKRPELIYTNLMRLKEVAGGKLQIIHAGNAHPHDPFSQEVIHRMIQRSEELKDSVKIVYMPNYNPALAKHLVAGSDIWLNTPMRLHEASGTSGMKACLNGTINLSTLDGWWVEGYGMDSRSGWRIGPLASALNPDDTRMMDAEDLYTQLQYQVIPDYTMQDKSRWIERMRRSISLMGYFNSERCVREYCEKAWR